MIHALLVPNISVGDFKIGDTIKNYLHKSPTLYLKKDEYIENLYAFKEPPVDVFVDDLNNITNITCSFECIWKGQNLISMDYYEFLKLSKTIPDSFEKIYLLINNRGQNQTVYTFENFGLQIWVWNGNIVTVSATKY
ncbi:hypothetical protein A0256_20755 [Mucilaginibacter sp. PAMC 26640]|nr:hypothetical protein A0256_20755 [Mucilaginibacter sp. PAMC 26640]